MDFVFLFMLSGIAFIAYLVFRKQPCQSNVSKNKHDVDLDSDNSDTESESEVIDDSFHDEDDENDENSTSNDESHSETSDDDDSNHNSIRKKYKIGLVYDATKPTYTDTKIEEIANYLRQKYKKYNFTLIDASNVETSLAATLEKLYLKCKMDTFIGFPTVEALEKAEPFFKIRDDALAITTTCGGSTFANTNNIIKLVPHLNTIVTSIADFIVNVKEAKHVVIFDFARPSEVAIKLKEQLKRDGIAVSPKSIAFDQTIGHQVCLALEELEHPEETVVYTAFTGDSASYFLEQAAPVLQDFRGHIVCALGTPCFDLSCFSDDSRTGLTGKLFRFSRFFMSTPEVEQLYDKLQLVDCPQEVYDVVGVLDAALLATQYCKDHEMNRKVTGFLGNLESDQNDHLLYFWYMMYVFDGSNNKWEGVHLYANLPEPIGTIDQSLY